MNLEQIRIHFKDANYNKALDEVLDIVNKLKKVKKFSLLKNTILAIKDEQTLYMLIRILDYGLMYQYSNFLARIAYKQHQSLWTLSWTIDDYIESGKTLEMAHLLGSRIDEGELEQYPKEIREKIYFTYLQVLLELKRFSEVKELLNKMHADSGSSLDDKWGYYYLEKGERIEAKQYFWQGRHHAEYGHKCYAMLSHLAALEGNHEEAYDFVQEGIATFGEMPNLLMERIRRLRDMSRQEEMISDIEQLVHWIPDVFYKPYFLKLKADYLYEKEEYDALNNLVVTEISLKDSPYHSIQDEGTKHKLHINPVIQKSNYCVPASLSMILSFYGEYRQQDEIADCIFDKVGSKLSTTITYWESIGYTCNYITADLTTLKKCIDNGMPILLSVNVGLFSHVQIVTGYDEHLEVVYIQDANTFETLLISFEDYIDTHLITNYLGIVGVPQAQFNELQILSTEDHLYYRSLFEYLELIEKDEKMYLKKLIAFLEQYWNHAYTKLFIIKHLHDEDMKQLFNKAIEEMEEKMAHNGTVCLHIVNGYLNFGHVEEAKEIIKRVQKKQMNGFYHFLQGRIAYEEERFEDGIQHFKWSVKADADDVLTWSYLSLTYLYNQELQAALEASYMAYENHNDDLFIILNHCKVLMANNLFEEALQVFIMNPQVPDNDAYKSYTLAKVYLGLGQLTNAVTNLRKALTLDSQFTNAYLMLAKLLDEEMNDQEEAEKVLLKGMEQADEQEEIIIQLGQLYLDQEKYDIASEQFQKCMMQFPEYSFGYVKYADTLVDMGLKEEAHQLYDQYYNEFNNDIEFLINAGISFLYKCEDEYKKEKGITFLEEGIEIIENNWEEPLNVYVKTISENKFFERGIAFLTKMINQHHSLAFAFQTYKGMLLEDMTNQDGFLDIKEAFEMKKNVFSAYQLGEAYFKRGKLEEAKTTLQFCYEQNWQDIRYLFKLIEIAKIEENKALEKKCYQKLFTLDFTIVDFKRFFSLLDHEELDEYIIKLTKNEMSTTETERLECLACANGALEKKRNGNR
ncbi:C39 family peptidase [Bacillus massiliigorillae]|uniref:C39 family peptidase n=1 Tax=Bacillus massiliigorillae TaxID=1243664 RepID=UPI0003A7BA81|nr:C39 family peptidase [Bacillus massiliigorillae]